MNVKSINLRTTCGREGRDDLTEEPPPRFLRQNYYRCHITLSMLFVGKGQRLCHYLCTHFLLKIVIVIEKLFHQIFFLRVSCQTLSLFAHAFPTIF